MATRSDDYRAGFKDGIKNARNVAHSLLALDGQTLETYVEMLDILIAAGEEKTDG